MKLKDFLPANSGLEEKVALISAGAAAGLAVSKATNVDSKKAAIIGAGVCLLAAALIRRCEK